MLKIGPKNNNIEFKLEVENTTLDKISSRLVVEVNGEVSLIPLQIDKNGVVKGNIPLNKTWDEKVGNLKLEVINESNYFIPFEKVVLFSNPQPKQPVIKEFKTTETPNETPIKQTSKVIKENKLFIPSQNLLDLNKEINNFFKSK
jgi:hypothetical protein